MDRIIFGDNQFFGINHMSEEKARSQAMKFNDLQAILDTVDVAFELGIRGFMFTTHDRVREICQHVRKNKSRYEGMGFYPVMPYAHKYANAVAEKGVVGAIREATTGNVLKLLASGSRALLQRDSESIMRVLVDAEMAMFKGLDVRVVFLQNIVTDLMLGMGLVEPLKAFAGYVEDRYKVEAGFITLNLPRLVDELHRVGIERPIVCSSINKIGYLMNPSREAYEETLAKGGFRPVAMSILASGAVSPREAVEYVVERRSVEAIVYGASSRNHIQETKKLIESASATTG